MTQVVAKAALGQNQALQASHHILTLLERSKENLESFVDALPSVVAVVTGEGIVAKGNVQLAESAGWKPETLLGKSLRSLFQPATWELFADHLRQVVKGAAASRTFELPLDGGGEGVPTYSWTLKPFTGHAVTHDGALGLVSVFGTDVTEIRAYERQISQIFSSIPLGILRVDAELRVVPPCSRFTNLLLRRDHLEGAGIHELLFAPSWSKMTPQAQEQCQNLRGVVGFPPFQFDLIKDALPRLVCLPGSTEDTRDRWIGITYDPIVQGEVIDGLLIVLEDRTEVERLRQEQDAKRRDDETVITRYVDVRRLSLSARAMVGQDLSVFAAALTEATAAKDVERCLRTLHGIKGVARVSQLTALKSLAHGTEDFLQQAAAAGALDWERGAARLRAVLHEWDEVAQVLAAIGGRLGAAPETLRSPQTLALLAPSLTHAVEATAKSLGKSVTFTIDLEPVPLAPQQAPAIREFLLHLLNNAVDHGLEASGARRACGKSETGTISLIGRQEGDRVVLVISDDGGGIDPDRVAAAAVKKGVIKAETAALLSREERQKLIFAPGFSTRDAATEISGRGVGLDAVAASVKFLGGTIDLISEIGRGTQFIVKFLRNH